jgi:ribosomal protein S18 acetylase RimI-like enzyme
MDTELHILNSTVEDIPEIFRLYRLASAHQRSKKTVVVWPEFSEDMVRREVLEMRQWKIMIGEQIACVWAITFSDPQIWGERNKDKAIYIHRIATNPEFRGRDFVKSIAQWAEEFAGEMGLDYVRLDTIGNNTRLIQLYTEAGFTFLGMFELQDISALPEHYKEGPACLFEMKVHHE